MAHISMIVHVLVIASQALELNEEAKNVVVHIPYIHKESVQQ